MGTPLARGLPMLTCSDYSKLWVKMSRIQTLLRADMSPYQMWPTRILPFLAGEFLGLARGIETKTLT